MASLEFTVFERMTSDISRLRAISSLPDIVSAWEQRMRGGSGLYKLLSVAFWTCSSIWEVDANQPAIMFSGPREREYSAGRGDGLW